MTREPGRIGTENNTSEPLIGRMRGSTDPRGLALKAAAQVCGRMWGAVGGFPLEWRVHRREWMVSDLACG